MVAARAKEVYAEMAKRRKQVAGKRARDKQLGVTADLREPRNDNEARHDREASGMASQTVGVSGRQVDKASKVLSQGAKPLVEACDRR